VAVLVLVTLAVSPSAIAAASGSNSAALAAQRLARVKGTISDFNATSITIKTRGGDVKAVAITDNTKFYVHGKLVTDPTLGKGESIAVLAHLELDGSLTALNVRLGAQTKNGLVFLGGRISAFNATSVTVKTKTGDVKAAELTTKTRYYLDGKPAAVRPPLHLNERIRVLARVENDGSLRALRVRLIDRDDLTFSGSIADFNAGSLTLSSQGDVRAFKLMDSTKYYVDGKLVAQRPVFHQGERVRVFAEREQDGSFNALRVYVGIDRAVVQIRGKVSDFNAISITIVTIGNDVMAVRLTSSTRYYVNGKLIAGLPALSKGEAIRVNAHRETDGSLTEKAVFLKTA